MKLKKVDCFNVSRFRVLAEDFFALTVPQIVCMKILNSKAILPPGSFAGSLRAYYILWDREDTLQYLVFIYRVLFTLSTFPSNPSSQSRFCMRKFWLNLLLFHPRFLRESCCAHLLLTLHG